MYESISSRLAGREPEVLAFMALLLSINMILGSTLYSVDSAALAFVVCADLLYVARIDSRFLILAALVLLGYVPLMLLSGRTDIAELIGIYTFYLLWAGVGLRFAQELRQSYIPYSFDAWFKHTMNDLGSNQSIILLVAAFIITILLSFVITLSWGLWTAGYFLALTLIARVVSSLGASAESKTPLRVRPLKM